MQSFMLRVMFSAAIACLLMLGPPVLQAPAGEVDFQLFTSQPYGSAATAEGMDFHLFCDVPTANAQVPAQPVAAVSGNRIVIVTQNGCFPCAQAYQDAKPWAEKAGWKVEEVNLDTSPQRNLYRNVASTPTFVIYVNGQERERLANYHLVTASGMELPLASRLAPLRAALQRASQRLSVSTVFP